MIRISQLKIKHEQGGNETKPEKLKAVLLKKAASGLKLSPDKIESITIARHSVDARKKPEIFDVYAGDVALRNTDENRIVKQARSQNISILKQIRYELPMNIKSPDSRGGKRPVIVGSGPAGLFCAYVLARAGLRPLLIERGKSIAERKTDVERFWAGAALNEESNVQFGEGGAGTFSDGKLYTGTNDRDGRQRFVLETFVRHGANENILYEANPHIGTDRLEAVIADMRRETEDQGGEYLFSTKLSNLQIEQGRLTGIELESPEGRCFIKTDLLVLAVGHSARDTFEMLAKNQLAMEKKPFAVGLRVAHPQEMINAAMYGEGAPRSLPPSPYKLTARSLDGRGIYSFCMCPGGYIVNASSEQGATCVNGMSYSGRDGYYANSAVVVTVTPDDFNREGVLAGCAFQRDWEKQAFQAGQGKVPVEFFGSCLEKARHEIRGMMKAETDFMKENVSSTAVKQDVDLKALSSILEGGTAGRKDSLHAVRPEGAMKGLFSEADVYSLLPFPVRIAIVQGMLSFGKRIKGFDNEGVLLAGIESRTSSPVRVLRGDDLESLSVRGLYPCGEGAGYAGGIMSAAADGIKTAEAVIRKQGL